MAKRKENTRKVYDYIKEFIQENQYPPTCREICEGTGIKSTNTVHYHIHRLVDMGVIALEEHKVRTIKVLGDLIEK